MTTASSVLMLVLAACGYYPTTNTDRPSTEHSNPVAAIDVQALRSEGPPGLAKALALFDRLKASNDPSHDLVAMENQIDEIASQRHAIESRLYWYTDLEQAKQVASEHGKPILSLRMLGNLTDEFSCANSRFFRTALYANEEISDRMREDFVLHWQSVRPVPKVTIDFGDGRTLHRTVTGNSAHYVLDANGKPLDVLPGLYSPQRFSSWLKDVSELASFFGDAKESGKGKIRRQTAEQKILRDYNNQCRIRINKAWASDIKQVAPELMGLDAESAGAGDDSKGLVYVDAMRAANRAMAKSVAEVPILRAIEVGPQETDRMVSDQLWQKLAYLHRPEVKLDRRSVDLVKKLNVSASLAGNLAVTKRQVENPVMRMIRKFEDSIALDTVRNEYMLHRQVHDWYLRGEVSADVDKLNERVYADLFLTPSTDPWLGLSPKDTFTALNENPFINAPIRTNPGR